MCYEFLELHNSKLRAKASKIARIGVERNSKNFNMDSILSLMYFTLKTSLKTSFDKKIIDRILGIDLNFAYLF